MKKLSEKKKRKEARKAANAIIERFLQKYGSRLKACVIVNSKGEPLSLNVSKLASIYTQFFPTVYQEDGKFYFQYSKKRVWVKTSLLEITRQIKKIVHSLYPDFWKAGFNKEIEAILPLTCKTVKQLEKATDYINLRNGLFSLTTFELEPHRKKIFSTTQLDFSYDPKAKCPEFEKFLSDVFLGNKRLKKILAEAFGYGLSPHIEAQKFFLLYSEGSSGKSVACDVLYHLAGGKEQVSSVALRDLSNNFQRSQMYRKLVNISTENEGKFNSQALKAITSGDLIQLEFKGKDPFSDVITAKMFFAVNTLPVANDKTFAYMRRVVLIPFLARFVSEPDKAQKREKKLNPNIKEKLLQELPGIFNWAMRGLKRLIKNKYQFTKSKVAQKVLGAYAREVNPICSFINDAITANKKSEITQDRLYATYTVWAKKNGERVESKRSFLKDLRRNLHEAKIPFGERKSNGKRFFTCITLNNPSTFSIDEV